MSTLVHFFTACSQVTFTWSLVDLQSLFAWLRASSGREWLQLVGWQLALAGPHWATRPHFSCRAATPAEPSPPRTLCAGTAGRAADGSNRLPDSCHKRSTTGISTLPTGGELVTADLAPSERLRPSLSSPTELLANTLGFLSTWHICSHCCDHNWLIDSTMKSPQP